MMATINPDTTMKKTPKDYVKRQTGADVTALSDADALKLAKWVNQAVALESPTIAQCDRVDYDLPEPTHIYPIKR